MQQPEEKERNKALIEKYPFLQPRSVWNDGIPDGYDYSYTLLDGIPEGWRIAFGEMLVDEIAEELKKHDYLYDYRIVEIKEKWGQLRIYDNGVPKGCKVWDIIGKYGVLSENICMKCGKPDVRSITSGWIYPICLDCYLKERKTHTSESYLKDTDGSSDHMSDIRKYSECKDGEWRSVEIDISGTATKIRKRYYERVKGESNADK